MEVITAPVFKAFDGMVFTSSSECKRYERQRKEFLDNLKFFIVYYSPDLAETGLFTRQLLVAVYSKEGLHKEIVNNFCIKNFGYFDASSTDFETYSKGILEDWRGDECHPKKILLSPIKLDEFKDIERFDYMKEWGFK